MALSLGSRVMEDQVIFVRIPTKRPLFIFKDGSVVILDVLHCIPYLTSKSIQATLGDDIILQKCGLHVTSSAGQCWASFPIGDKDAFPAVPATTSEDEVPQVGADDKGAVANFDPASVDSARWRLLATKHVKQAAATPTLGGADQGMWNLCDRRVVTTSDGVMLCDDMSVQQLHYGQLYRSLPNRK